MINKYKGKALNAIVIFSMLSGFGIQTVEAQDNSEVVSGYNALDMRLQKGYGNERFTDKSFAERLFFSVEAGPGFLHRSENQLIGTPDMGARAGASIGSWFTPVHGFKLGVNFGARKEHLEKSYGFVGLSADYLMNLSSLAHNYSPLRKFEFIGVAGFEYQRRFRTPFHSNVFGAHLGLQTRYNVTPSTFIYLEPRFGVYTDNVNTRRGWQRYDWEASVLVGLGYRVSGAHARYRTRIVGDSFFDNMFYGFSVGVNALARRHMSPLSETLGASGSLLIGKWASTISGWRLKATGGFFGQKGEGHPKIGAAEIDYIFNINSAFNGFNPENRFNTNVILGPVVATTSRHSGRPRIGLSAGLQGVVGLTRNLQLLIEPGAWVFGRNLAPYSKVNVLPSVNIGFQYRLGRYEDDLMKYDFARASEEFKGADKWFITLSGGLLARRSSWGESATLSAGFGRWFSPLSAWRVTANASYINNLPRYGSGTINVDYMMSLTTLFCDYNPERVFDLIAYAGAHGGAAYYTHHGYNGVYGLQCGMQAKFNVSKKVDLFVEPQLFTTRASGYDYSGTEHWRVMLGLNYKFGGRRADGDASLPSSDGRNYVAVSAGPGIFSQGFRSWTTKKECGGFDVVAGRNFTAVSAVQAGLGYDFVGQREGDVIAIGTFHADYLLNVSQLVDRNPSRKFDISGLVGVGMGWSSHRNSSVGFAAQAGIQFKWSLNPTIDVIAEPRATIWQPRACNFGENLTRFVGAPKLMLGARYKF